MDNIEKNVILLQCLEFFCKSDDSDIEFAMDTSLSSDDSEDKRTENVITVGNLVLRKIRSKNKVRPRVKDYIEKVVPNYTAEEFKTHFRLLPATFEFLLGLIGPVLSTTNSISGRKPISADKQLLMALWMMATPDSYRSVCCKFNLGKATAIRTMRRVAYTLHTLAPRFIVWPRDERANEVMRQFERTSAFPNIIGAIDGTHIKIKVPQDDKQSYVNRKGYHSIHVQAVCTQNLLFTSVLAGNVGSVHDARVFRLSNVSRYIDNAQTYFPNNSHIVGDSAYELLLREHLDCGKDDGEAFLIAYLWSP